MPDGPRVPAPVEGTPSGRFLSGSILRHVVVMSATGSVGLMAIFLVDLLSLLYVSKLGDPALTAAVGFAAIVQFFAISINIGLMIAGGALVSRAIGSGDPEGATRLSTSVTVLGAIAAAIVVIVLLASLDLILPALGADAHTLPVAKRFLWITLPSNLLMAPGMIFTGLLRSVGAAREAMNVTLGGAILSAILDPILIFWLGLGVDGAAITTCLARLTFFVIGWLGVRRYRLIDLSRASYALDDAPALARIALPAVLTNLAPPIASAVIAHALSRFGTSAVAANVVIDRLSTVAFCGLFALSGAIGPILGQNWGASRFDRMRGVLRDGAIVATIYVAVVWLALVLTSGPLARLFELEGVAENLFVFFCRISGVIWFFNGLLFLSNASFNNLGFPLLSTGLNWGRATIGTIPLALLGAAYFGPEGVIAATGGGSLAFGLIGLALAFRTISTLERRTTQPNAALVAIEPAASA